MNQNIGRRDPQDIYHASESADEPTIEFCTPVQEGQNVECLEGSIKGDSGRIPTELFPQGKVHSLAEGSFHNGCGLAFCTCQKNAYKLTPGSAKEQNLVLQVWVTEGREDELEDQEAEKGEDVSEEARPVNGLWISANDLSAKQATRTAWPQPLKFGFTTVHPNFRKTYLGLVQHKAEGSVTKVEHPQCVSRSKTAEFNEIPSEAPQHDTMNSSTDVDVDVSPDTTKGTLNRASTLLELEEESPEPTAKSGKGFHTAKTALEF